MDMSIPCWGDILVCWYVFGWWNMRFEGDDCSGDGWDRGRGYSVSIDLWEMDGNE